MPSAHHRRKLFDTESNSSTYEVVTQPNNSDSAYDETNNDYYYPYTNYTSNATDPTNSTGDFYQPPPPPVSDPGDSDMNNDFDGTSNSNAATDTQYFDRMRIRALLMDDQEILTPTERDALLQDMVQPALDIWGQALRVRPVQGPLTIDPTQLRDGQWCGPGPAVAVPSSHIHSGWNATDFVLYLHVGRAINSTWWWISNDDTNQTEWDEQNADASDGGGGGEEAGEDIWPTDEMEGDNEWLMNDDQNTTEPRRREGWNATDDDNNALYLCQGDYVAASAFCNTDQWDRPVAAILHLCLDDDFFTPERLHRNIRVIMHEMGHSLGLNAVSLAHFRKWDGSPRTPRDANGAVPLQEVECTGPMNGGKRRQLQQDEEEDVIHGNSTELSPMAPEENTSARYDVIPLPSSDILRFRTVRGVRVAQIVTPSVLQVVRNHFGCQSLEGAELESDDDICLGDHWERRLFKTDLMNPIIDKDATFVPRISTLTLAYFADSGWYQVDLSKASLASGWGRGAGCAFVEEPCVDQNGQVPPGLDSIFCSSQTTGYRSLDGCTHDLLKKASCLLDQYQEQLPTAYQYFNHTYGSNVGGPDPFVDYCPFYAGFSNGLCSDGSNEALIKVSPMERVGSRNSRCLAGQSAFGKTALCLRIGCIVEDKSLRVQVDRTWFTCTHEGQTIQTRLGFQVTCPDPVRTCPTFYCPRDCLGSPELICDYSQGECVCPDEDMSLPSADGSCPHNDPEDMGSEATSQPDGGSNSGGAMPGNDPFYRPPASHQTVVPVEDSPLQDIYFQDERALHEQIQREEPRSYPWTWQWPVMAVMVTITMGAALWVRRLRKRRATELPLTSLDFPDNDDDNNDPPPPSLPVAPCRRPGQKRKMMATVAVDLRLQEQLSNVWVQGEQEQSDAQTDTASVSDTEGDFSLSPPRTGRRRPPPMAAEYLRPTIVEIPARTPPEMECPPAVARSSIRRRRRMRDFLGRAT
jgi:hypothetical protein